jgi:hypothetical protein
MDDSRRSYVEERSPQEDTRAEHCQNIETDRRGYPPKGIQSRSVPRFASLTQFSQFNGREAPSASFYSAKSPTCTFAPTCWSGGPRTWPFVRRQFSFFSGRPLKAFIAFTVVAASLFNPLQTSVATVRFVGAVSVQTGLHSCLPGGLTRVLGRYRIGKYRVAGRSWCGRGRRLGRCRFRRLCSWSRGRSRRRGCCCIRSALRLAEIVPLHATERARFLGSIVLCTALLHRKCVSRIALYGDGNDKRTSRYRNLTEDHGIDSLSHPHPRTHHSTDFDGLVGTARGSTATDRPRRWPNDRRGCPIRRTARNGRGRQCAGG